MLGFPPKQACVNCHFFSREVHAGERPVTFEIVERDRQLCRIKDYSWQQDHTSLKCDFGVRDEGHNFDRVKKHETIVWTNRRGFCFFRRWHPGMLLPAARHLSELELTAGNAARDRRLTISGLWIAALALMTDVILRSLKWLRNGKGAQPCHKIVFLVHVRISGDARRAS